MVWTYEDIGDAAAPVLGALSVSGLDVETEDTAGVTAKTRHGSHLTAEWVNGETRGVLPAKNLVAYLTVYPQVRIFGLQSAKRQINSDILKLIADF